MGLEPTTPSSGAVSWGDDARRRTSTIPYSYAGLRHSPVRRPAWLRATFPDVCGVNVLSPTAIPMSSSTLSPDSQSHHATSFRARASFIATVGRRMVRDAANGRSTRAQEQQRPTEPATRARMPAASRVSFGPVPGVSSRSVTRLVCRSIGHAAQGFAKRRRSVEVWHDVLAIPWKARLRRKVSQPGCASSSRKPPSRSGVSRVEMNGPGL